MRDDERVEFAVRAAAADLAVRLQLSESTVRGYAFDADTLRTRLPRLWAAFREGDVNRQSTRAPPPTRPLAARRGRACSAGSTRLSPASRDLAPGRFRMRARVLRERIHAVALAERVAAAAQTRGVWIDNDVDGMAYLTMKLPADVAHRAFARIDAAARNLATRCGRDAHARSTARRRRGRPAPRRRSSRAAACRVSPSRSPFP